jgi:hypothetical protein
LRNNQVRAVDLIIKYIIKYQNNFSSSYLFYKNMPLILSKGIKVSDLLNSSVFKLYFKNEKWPDTHACNETAFMPYNG